MIKKVAGRAEKEVGSVSLTVFIDARLMFYAGIGRYLRELIYNICDIDKDVSFYLLGDKKKLTEFIESDKSGILSPERFTLLNSGAKKYSFGEQLVLHYFFIKYSKKADIVFCPHFNVPLFYLPKNSVVTVHDLTFFKFPSYFGRFKTHVAKILLKRVLKRAGKIITISNFVKNDIISMFAGSNGDTGTDGRIIENSGNFSRILKNKIEVIYLGLGAGFVSAKDNEIEKFKAQKNLDSYILYCGNIKKHKNIIGLIKAYEMVKKDLHNLKLVIIGSRFKKYDFADKYIDDNRIAGIVELKNVSDGELRLYYGGADAFVFFSLSEGFGFAPLEAASCGAPLILSSATSLPEVFEGAAVFANPYSTSDMAEAIKKVITDDALREELRDKSLGLAGKYSYRDTAVKTLKVFRALNSSVRV